MPHTNHTDEQGLLLRIANGDQGAFTIIVNTYSNKIYSVALTYLKSPVLAEDIVQEILIKLWRKREKLAGIDSLENFIFIITRNEVFSAMRKKGPAYPVGAYLESTVPEKGPLPDQELDARQLQAVIDKGISLLTDRQREAWKLSREGNFRHEEIAELMGLSKNTVKVHIVKALNFLRTYIQEHHQALLILCSVFYCKN